MLIGGNIPRKTQVASQYIQQQIEIDRPVNAAAVSVALLAIAFVTLLRCSRRASPSSEAASSRSEDAAMKRLAVHPQLSLRTVALGYLFVLLVVPLVIILWRTFEQRDRRVLRVDHHARGDLRAELSLLIVAIVVPVNVVFGIVTALALVRGRFPGRGLVQAIVDLPFAVSPIVVGVSLILLWGASGWFGGIESLGFKVIFGLPGMVIATIFVTLPFVVREVEPVLHEIGDEQEQAAATLGASDWQTFWRITLPAIRWGLTYGVVLTVARVARASSAR